MDTKQHDIRNNQGEEKITEGGRFSLLLLRYQWYVDEGRKEKTLY
jgi:hypothetical protein